MTGKTYNFTQISQYYWIIGELGKNIKKTNIKNDVCLHSETLSASFLYKSSKASFTLLKKPFFCGAIFSSPLALANARRASF